VAIEGMEIDAAFGGREGREEGMRPRPEAAGPEAARTARRGRERTDERGGARTCTDERGGANVEGGSATGRKKPNRKKTNRFFTAVWGNIRTIHFKKIIRTTPRGGSILEFREFPLRCYRKNAELALNSTFFE
jgi:hypothetical protein